MYEGKVHESCQYLLFDFTPDFCIIFLSTMNFFGNFKKKSVKPFSGIYYVEMFFITRYDYCILNFLCLFWQRTDIRVAQER